MLRFTLSAALLAFCLVSSAPAQVFAFTYTGTTTSASGAPGTIWDAVQSGDAMTAVYLVDISVPPVVAVPGQDHLYVGAILSLDLTIGGISVSPGFQASGPGWVQVRNNRLFTPNCQDFLDLVVFGDGSDSLSEFSCKLVHSLPLPACSTALTSLAIPLSPVFADFTTSQAWLLRTTSFDTLSGDLTSVTVTVAPPANDNCADAIALPSTFADTAYNAIGATTDGLDAAGFCDYGPFGDEQNYNDTWFTYTPDVGGCTYISTLGLAGYNTRLAVYDATGCPDMPENMIACVDDEEGPTAPSPSEAGLDVNLQAGVTYTIRLGTFQGAPAGAGTLRIAAGPAAVNTTGPNPGAPGCEDFPSFCNGDGGDQMGCTNCPCANNASPGTVGGCLNSASSSTRIAATGNPSASLPPGVTTDLRLTLSGAPAGALCVMLSGDALAPQNMGNVCFGLNSGVQSLDRDGVRCTVLNLKRHGGRSASALGEVMDSAGPSRVWGGEAQPNGGLWKQGGFVAGQTRYFQVTYREDVLAGCMRGLNTSQAVKVTFTP